MKPSLILFQNRDHPLWSKIDWDLGVGMYVCVDPMDAHGILYLSPREYHSMVKTCISTDTKLVVLYRPGESHSSSDSDATGASGSQSRSYSTSPSVSQSGLWLGASEVEVEEYLSATQRDNNQPNE